MAISMAGGWLQRSSLISSASPSKPSGQDMAVQLCSRGKEQGRGKIPIDKYCLIDSIAWQVELGPTATIRAEQLHYASASEHTLYIDW